MRGVNLGQASRILIPGTGSDPLQSHSLFPRSIPASEGLTDQQSALKIGFNSFLTMGSEVCGPLQLFMSQGANILLQDRFITLFLESI